MLKRALVFLFALVAAPIAAHAQPQPLHVMTFNVRLMPGEDGDNSWQYRRDLLVDTVRKADPDIFGTQELFKQQGDYIVDHLPQFGWFGVDRKGGHSDEHMGVFYRRDRLKLLDMGNFWLSDTPDVVGSNSWGQPFPRMATWGLFERKADGKRFYFFNTHFPYREQDVEPREKAARVLQSRIAALPQDVPVVLTGDFNTTPGSKAHGVLTQSLADVWESAETRSGPAKTFHNFTGTPDRRIDWILERGFSPQSATTVTMHRDGHYPSDHFPVETVLDFD